MAHDMSTGAQAGGGATTPYTDDLSVTTTSYAPTGDVTASQTQDVSEQSVGELLAKVTGDLSQLMRQEVELAKAEAKEEAKKAGKAAGMLGGAGFAGYMVALFATVAVMAGLAAVMPWGWAALIVTVVWAIVALVLYSRGRGEMKRVQGMPRTKDSLKEDAEWARHPTS
jgi:Flp pilus assembly protein TadB